MEDRIIDAGEEISNDGVDYISAINEVKQNSVSKDKYAKLQQENKRLLDALVSNKQIEEPVKEEVNIPELRQKLFSEQGVSNLEYIDTALKLRTALMEKGDADPFLPIGSHTTITYEMQETAQNVADVLQECVDFAQGDSGIFSAELQRRTKDIMPQKKFR